MFGAAKFQHVFDICGKPRYSDAICHALNRFSVAVSLTPIGLSSDDGLRGLQRLRPKGVENGNCQQEERHILGHGL